MKKYIKPPTTMQYLHQPDPKCDCLQWEIPNIVMNGWEYEICMKCEAVRRSPVEKRTKSQGGGYVW